MKRMNLEQTIALIGEPDRAAMDSAKKRWDSIAKPLCSLGLLEEAIIQIAGITGSAKVTLDKRALVIMCADNGVVEAGVTQVGAEVTAVVTENFTKNNSCVCHMAAVAGVDTVPVDIGVGRDVDGPGLVHSKIAYGTKNMANQPAMTREEAVAAIEVGIQQVNRLCGEGYQLIATGEMGIGNTTSSSAIASVLLDRTPATVTGRGAGLSGEGLERKIRVIEDAIALHKPDPADPLDVLAKVGGLDIAGLAGVFIGCAANKIPVVVDGFISAVSALVAVRICPLVRAYLVASHVSKEPAGAMLLEELALHPFIHGEMCLGEGTGAMACIPILDMALRVYSSMSTFEETQIEEYVHFT